MENIKDKIKKLLALSGNANDSDAESYSALQKAQELMARYKLSERDITEEDLAKKVCIKKRTTLSYGTRSSDHYLSELATIIADNFCCVTYQSTPRGTRTHYINFMGMEDDVAICEEAMDLANHTIVRGYNRVYKSVCKQYDIDYVPAKYFNPLKIGYIDGYLAGLKSALEAQRGKNEEWGLVLVAPQEATDFLSGLESKDFGQVTYVDNTYYEDGYTDGKNFHLNKKLDNSSNDIKMIQ